MKEQTDRELLERAAKAAGLRVGQGDGDYFYCEHGSRGAGMYCKQGNSLLHWNSLADDGDTFRLEVKLNLRHVFHPVLNQALVRNYENDDQEAETRENGEDHADPYAASRRAITRAAAAIGEAMP